METRSRAPPAATEADLLILQKQLAEKERRLRKESETLDQQRREIPVSPDFAELRARLEALEAERDHARARIVKAEHESEQLRRELSETRRALDSRGDTVPLASESPRFSGTSRIEPVTTFSLKEAVESLPQFDGNNMPVLAFTRACKRARDILPDSAEGTLTKLIINKLRGRAYTAIEDDEFHTVGDLSNRLKAIFGPRNGVDHYRGEMANVYQYPNEHILDYISRVKDLKTAIVDGSHDTADRGEINRFTVDSFIAGLIPQIRSEMRAAHHRPLTIVFNDAIDAAKRYDLDQTRYGPRRVQFSDALGSRSELPRPLLPRDSWRSQTYMRRDGALAPPTYRDRRTYSPARPERPPAPPPPPTPRPTYEHPPRRREEPRFCRYCKTPGHDIYECRKREYNNRNQGNERSLPLTADRKREGSPKPVRHVDISPPPNESTSRGNQPSH